MDLIVVGLAGKCLTANIIATSLSFHHSLHPSLSKHTLDLFLLSLDYTIWQVCIQIKTDPVTVLTKLHEMKFFVPNLSLTGGLRISSAWIL